MKKSIIYKVYKTFLVMAVAAVGSTMVSCDSFLDRQEDEQMTFDKIWQQVSTTQRYFYQCMGYLPKEGADLFGSYGNQSITHTYAASDESSFCWAWGYQSINYGSWNATNMPNSNYNHYYAAIRDCNIFLQNVMNCSDPQAVISDLQLWYNCVRWARAYYYFLLMRDFGPIFLVGDELVDPNASLESLARPRDSWEDCVNYVVSEMEAAAKGLDSSYPTSRYGLPTRGAALAVIARLKLYSARPLFNGNALYRNVGENAKGEPLFPRDFKAEKWLEAAQAAKAVIDLGQYQLYTDSSNDPYLNYLGIMMEPWNKELIFSSQGYQGRFQWAVHTSPAGLSGVTAYGGWGPTQQQVDAYAMSNGRYPITGYNNDGSPVIDQQSGYRSDEFTMQQMYANPFLTALNSSVTSQADAPMMYVGREPRFYVSVYWSGGIWRRNTENDYKANFAQGGNAASSHDYPHSGYLVNRYYDHTQAIGQWGNITFPTFRLGEVYLNYIEAVLNCEQYGVSGEGVDHTTAMQLWDELRARSGMQPITTIYPEAASDTRLLIELLHKERRVELAFEGLRYYDTRTWMIAEQTDNGPMYGMNTMARGSGDQIPADFWQRTVFENRVFKKQHYLFPFPQREIDRNSYLKRQNNYGW